MSENLTNPLKAAADESNELREKEYALRKERVEYQHDEYKRRKEQSEAFKNLPIGENILERAEKLKIENREYLEFAKQATVFLGLDTFKDKVALFPRNIILAGAETGTGKSTLCANFTLSEMRQKKKVLIITNEEYPTDILNRIICLARGWAYTNHDEVTEEMQLEFDRMYPIIMQRVEIIDDNFNGVGGTTTTLEGIKSICDALKHKVNNGEEAYGSIIVDYIQNIKSSIDNPNLPQWGVLDRFGAFLDSFKGQYPAPFLLLSQLKSSNSEHDTFKDRIEKFKAVMNHATTAIEVKADRDNLRTEWIFRKSRFKNCVGTSVYTGYDKGAYIEYSKDFMNKVRLKNEERKHKDLLSRAFKKDDK